MPTKIASRRLFIVFAPTQNAFLKTLYPFAQKYPFCRLSQFLQPVVNRHGLTPRLFHIANSYLLLRGFTYLLIMCDDLCRAYVAVYAPCNPTTFDVVINSPTRLFP